MLPEYVCRWAYAGQRRGNIKSRLAIANGILALIVVYVFLRYGHWEPTRLASVTGALE